jgi:hypothetical protein
MVHQDAAHDPGRYGQEMHAVGPRDRLAVDESDEGFIDERRGLQAVPDALARHAAASDAMELLMDQRDQVLEGALVALTPLQEQRSDVSGGFRRASF